MEQRSDVAFRAEKLYKNSREKFGYLIREVVSNAIHAVLIKKSLNKTDEFLPSVEFNVNLRDTQITITLIDNGEGFNDENRKYFTNLDTKNLQKERLHFHPKGQGRLAIVYFSDKSTYTSTHINASGELNRSVFEYPENGQSLFDINGLDSSPVRSGDTGTELQIIINKQQSIGRAITFFNKYSDTTKLSGWFIETFFPFFMENDILNLTVDLNGEKKSINKAFIEENVRQVPFNVKFDDQAPEGISFQLWLVEIATTPKSKNQITCFARHLRAEIESGKLEYEIDLPKAYDWRLTSRFFDDNVDQKGDKIEISEFDLEKIQTALNLALDSEFASQITANRIESSKNMNRVKSKYQSLSAFVDRPINQETRRVLKESDILNVAIEEKGKIERKYWNTEEHDNEEIGKLLNSSLQIYISHRGRVLQKLKDLIYRYNDDGEHKPELEEEVHDLFLRRGNTLIDSDGKNHLHNLWILDDKYTIFCETLQAKSTNRGQSASDIYIWADDTEKAKELLILELKSTTTAHNAGDKYDSMVAQVKRYAGQFFRDPTKVLNWHVDPKGVLYTGIILARKSDIYKELNSNNSGATPNKIPFLDSSYYFNEQFSTAPSSNAEPTFTNIRIEMYSYEDIYKLAESRNNVFLKLLNNEFKAVDAQN